MAGYGLFGAGWPKSVGCGMGAFFRRDSGTGAFSGVTAGWRLTVNRNQLNVSNLETS